MRDATNDRTPIAIELDEEEYAQLAALAAARGITLEALLDEIIDTELRRLHQEGRRD